MPAGPQAVAQAQRVLQAILRAQAAEITWQEAARDCGMTSRSLRRWRRRYERHGVDGLYDRRRRNSPRRAAAREVDEICALYRSRYAGWSVLRFHRALRRRHGSARSYSFVKGVLQGAGLVSRGVRRLARAQVMTLRIIGPKLSLLRALSARLAQALARRRRLARAPAVEP